MPTCASVASSTSFWCSKMTPPSTTRAATATCPLGRRAASRSAAAHQLEANLELAVIDDSGALEVLEHPHRVPQRLRGHSLRGEDAVQVLERLLLQVGDRVASRAPPRA